MGVRHLLSLQDLSREEVDEVVRRAVELKAWRKAGNRPPLFLRRTLAMIFEKSSTRTRVSFEAAMNEGGGSAIFLSARESQLGRGEPAEDTARVLSEMCDAIVLRTFDHDTVERFSASACVPVINGLTDRFHPCQLLADMMTYVEHRGTVSGRTVAWVGDGNNMCNSYINAAALMGFTLKVATPEGYEPATLKDGNKVDDVSWVDSPREAVEDADLVVTDVWASMGQEEETAARLQTFSGYQVDSALMRYARKDALFMHCLPAHRGEEVSAEVLEGPQSVVWDEAGNRLHAQKALLEFLFASSQ